MRILVTGANGFLGKHLVADLDETYALFGYDHTVFAHGGRMDGDLRYLVAIEEAMHKSKPDVIIHLAASCGGIGANQEKPGEFFYDNIVMGAQLIEAAREYGVKKFLQLGTVCAFPSNTQTPFREESLWNGYPEPTNAPYGIAKKALLVQLQAYRQQYGFNGIYLIPVNMYGPGDDFDLKTSHVIPAIIRKIDDAIRTRQPSVTFWGDGTPTREFLYVGDCARAIRLALERYDGPEPVNIGSGIEISIRKLVEMIAVMLDYKGEIRWDPSRPNGQMRRCLDTSRAKERFGFKAEVGLDDGLRKTVVWYRKKQGG